MQNKKKMKNGAFLGIWVPVLTLATAVAVAVPVVAENFKTILDNYVNRGEIIKTPASGTEQWDTVYNKASVKTKDEAVAASQSKVKDVCNEGFVLLKNKNNSLPISTSVEITMLGRDSVDPIYGGSGSGNVDTSTASTPLKGLQNAGFHINQEAYDFFSGASSNYPRASITMDNYDNSTYFIGEIPSNAYTFTPVADDVALVFIGRGGGEGGDLSTNLTRDSKTSASQALLNGTAAKETSDQAANVTAEVANYAADQHQLELSVEEKGVISYAKSHYSKTVVVINSSNVMELGDLKDDDGVNAVIWVGSPGSTGFSSLGNILSGAVNPSGHTADTWPTDLTADPTFKNFSQNGVNLYSDIGDGDVAGGNNGAVEAHFVEYEEGVYVGYRYYETRFGADETAYSSAVAYPFGYGLSYTTFSEAIVSHSEPSLFSSECSVTVSVTNTGSVAGKDVVEIYYSAPYTSGGVEKSSVNLVGFAKTGILASGASEEVTLTWDKSDMASYDYKTAKAYVLDSGAYTISLRSDSHNVVSSYSFNLDSTTYTNGRPSDKSATTNEFDDVSGMFKDTATSGYATNMSRSDFSGTYPTSPTAADANASTVITASGKTVADELAVYDVSQHNSSSDVAPTTGASNGLSLIDLRGKAYDDPAWNELLDELTDSDYAAADSFLNNNAYNTPGINTLGKPATVDHDGPAGFTSLFGSTGNCAWMSEVIISSTWNKQLAEEMGEAVGDEAIIGDGTTPFSGWYAPALNTHRSAFGGRNFEYYSEDPFLAGWIGANVVSGAADKGCYAYIKHFAMNDQEYMRTTNLCTWANEQAIREIYLKPFEIVVKNASATERYISDAEGTIASKTISGCSGVMSSFNRIGGTWAGGDSALMTNVLRNEWGFEGVGISDFNLYGYMSSDQGMRAGTDMQLTWTQFKGTFADVSSATAKLAIRQAVKNVCYTVANSNAMNGIAPGTLISYALSPWEVWIIVGDSIWTAAILAGAAWVIVRSVRSGKRHKDDDAKAA